MMIIHVVWFPFLAVVFLFSNKIYEYNDIFDNIHFALPTRISKPYLNLLPNL